MSRNRIRPNELPLKEFSQSPYSLTNRLLSIDNFGLPIPSFNLKGKTHITTWVGGLLSAMIFTITLAYATQKLHALYLGLDPTINENIEAKYFSDENGLNINLANKRFAIAIHGKDTKGKPEFKPIDQKYISLISSIAT